MYALEIMMGQLLIMFPSKKSSQMGCMAQMRSLSPLPWKAQWQIRLRLLTLFFIKQRWKRLKMNSTLFYILKWKISQLKWAMMSIVGSHSLLLRRFVLHKVEERLVMNCKRPWEGYTQFPAFLCAQRDVWVRGRSSQVVRSVQQDLVIYSKICRSMLTPPQVRVRWYKEASRLEGIRHSKTTITKDTAIWFWIHTAMLFQA